MADLQALADRTQAPLRAFLEAERAAGRVESYTPFWIFNGIAVRAHLETLRAWPPAPRWHWSGWTGTGDTSPLPLLSPKVRRGRGRRRRRRGWGEDPDWNIARVNARKCGPPWE